MNTSSIRHAWFPPTIPKRKHSLSELDAESEWPAAYRALSGPALPVPRPAKRIKALEGGLAGLRLDTMNAVNGVQGVGVGGWTKVQEEAVLNNVQVEEVGVNPSGSQIHMDDISEAGPYVSEAEPYISSIYEYASPYPTTTGSSVVSLPLRGEVSEASASDEEKDIHPGRERERETVVNVNARQGLPGYVVYEPEVGLASEKRKRGQSGDDGVVEMDEDEVERSSKVGKKKWFEPEKDRIVILDLESSEDESITRSPRRRRSAFSLNTGSATSSSTPSSPQKDGSLSAGRPRSQTDADGTDFIINPALLSHLSPTNTVGKPIIPREDDPGKAVVLFRPVSWGTGVANTGSESGSPTEESRSAVEEDEIVEMEASPLIQDEDAMDVDS
ncbi:hypothetical protein FRC09_002443 [Ceratobasidium sp. 395]|nr:hypothetical protein FRC09_002443 [Ceratobasidium sp. 395]